MSDPTLVRHSGTQWASIFLITLVVIGCENEKKSNPQFTAGRQALMRGQYEPAIEELQNYLRQKPDGALASRASFLIAKAQLGLGNNKDAREQFEQTLQKYGSSEEAHKSRYKLAMLSLIEGDKDDARRRFKDLTAKPSGTLVPEAAAMLRYLDGQDRGGADPEVPAGEE